jgi:hypothetical protein
VGLWPRWLRRVFVATFPISGPLWLLTAIAVLPILLVLALGVLVAGILIGTFQWLQIEWNRP